jgi:hypothetical protein
VAEPLSSGFDGVARRRIEPERKTTMTAKDKMARRKLSLLELATDLANVSRACKVMAIVPSKQKRRCRSRFFSR